jgi:ArsR family transcriptional regulator
MSMDRKSATAVRVAKALADPSRFEMLRSIAVAGEICCRDVVELFGVSQATVSHHLKILTDAGLLDGRRRGRFTYYSVRPGALEAHREMLARTFAPHRGRAAAIRRSGHVPRSADPTTDRRSRR